MEIPRNELLVMLYAKGYSIIIDTKEDSKYVTFIREHSLHPYKLSYTYSTEFTNDEIRKDVAYELLEWTGLKVKFTLDY